MSKMAQAISTRLSRHVSEQPPTLSRSVSTASLAAAQLRPKSRGSTTSLQSVGVGHAFQPPHSSQEQNIVIDQNDFYMQHAAPQFGHHPGEGMLQYQQQMAHMQQSQQMMDHADMVSQHDMRPMTQHGFHEMQQFPMQYPNGMPQYQLPPQHMQHMRHQSEQYEGSPAPDDSNNENGGAKRRKGTASSMANDQELRRLLSQYHGKTLKEVADEVQKNEGSGGKSEKAKQVFAMLWLQDSCQRSNSSVRRDRVFARYTERCGNERVPTLNPASFGKLVRIIFPNVQTRRLGVRGESKYHYVDLSLVPDDNDRNLDNYERPSTSSGIPLERPVSSASAHRSFSFHNKSASVSQIPQRLTMEIADFPTPGASFLPATQDLEVKSTASPPIQKLDCQYINTPTIRIPTYNMSNNLINSLPSIRPNMPATLATYLAMPSENSLTQQAPSSQDNPIELPDIHVYLAGSNYDHHIAKLLSDLYRSYCIDVIDAFRKCKDKSFFNHHSAFNGKMTVPVSKLFSLDCVAGWIQECDMRMYKQILRFMAPLVLQNVPEPVWATFDRISARLVGHLVSAFEEKCPSHVVAAKVVPAARFSNLLKKLRKAHTATLQVSRLLEDPQQRTQMWLDLMVMVDPGTVLDDSTPPPEALAHIGGMLRYDLRALIAPMDDALVNAAENDPTSTYAMFNMEQSNDTGVLSFSAARSSSLLERWAQWLERLPIAFEGHHPQCMLDWHTRYWRTIMNQIGTGGARSYQAWWYFEAFATQMLAFMTQMEGLLIPAEEQKLLDERELEKRKQYEENTPQNEGKRKRETEDVGGENRVHSRSQTVEVDTKPNSATTTKFPAGDLDDQDNVEDDDDADMEELRKGGPLDLPTFRTGFSSPMKQMHAPNQHDDSGIDLGLDTQEHIEDHDAIEAEKEAKKFNKRDWLLSSDPVDGPNATSSLGVVA